MMTDATGGPAIVGPERLERLLAGALAREAGAEGGEAELARARAMLGDHAFRHLHNEVSRLRREAVAEHEARLRRPPGFWGVFAAALLASLLAAAGALALATRPDLLARLGLGG